MMSDIEPMGILSDGTKDFLRRAGRMLIDGQWREAVRGGAFDVFDPSSGAKIASVAAGTSDDIDVAVKAARTAFASGPWSRMGAIERTRLLFALADAIEANLDELVQLESLDCGNPVSSLKHADFPMALRYLRDAATWSGKLFGETPSAHPAASGFQYVVREPVGVVGLITPWNAPFLMAVNKLGPALAAGCTCVVKPAELAPLSALRLGELIEEVGFPRGVVNIVTGLGHEAGQALGDHPDVNKISFTGSTRVGKSILSASASNLKRVTLELGGKSPIFVFPDADLEKAAEAISRESCFKSGQFCAAGTRLFVHAAVHDRLLELIAGHMKSVKVGPGLIGATQMGPVISAGQLEKIEEYVAAGCNDGGDIVTGGSKISSNGHFFSPTLMANTSNAMPIMRDEIFGPVLCASRFEQGIDLDAIASLGNDSPYGLAAKIWSRDIETTLQLARKLQAGSITVNGGGGDARLPFGGFKQSGLGREGGREGALSYTEVKSVSIGF